MISVGKTLIKTILAGRQPPKEMAELLAFKIDEAIAAAYRNAQIAERQRFQQLTTTIISKGMCS
jgi:hypothetical protein